MRNKIIKQILEDIYLIDPDLRKEEKKLIKLIEELIDKKPDAKFDKDFSLNLRREVLEKIDSLEKQKVNNFNLANLFFMKKPVLVGSGFLVLALLIVVSISIQKDSTSIKLSNESFNLEPKISRVNSQAFDSVGEVVQTNGANERSLEAPAGLGGGNGAYATSEAKMIMPDYINYKYNYVGEEFTVPELGDVYKKVTSPNAGQALAQNFQKDLGLLDLRKFKNTSLSNFSISEDREFGYQVSFNFVDNIVSINQNWDKWPNPNKDCRDNACFESNKLKIEDVPSDAEIISIAKAGINNYGIDTSMYGEPKINKAWRRSYDMAEVKSEAYIPDTISVIYPLRIEGKEVVEDYGYGVGLNVNVNIRYNKVSGINNIALNDFEVSSYPLEQDIDRLLKFAKQGGLYKRNYISEESRDVVVELGTPEVSLVANWKYNEETGRGENYYVPALVFPIVNEVDNKYYNRQSVSIPLLPELLDKAEEEDNNPVHPMPLPRIMEGEGAVQKPMIQIEEDLKESEGRVETLGTVEEKAMRK
jgi:hypothetical protein